MIAATNDSAVARATLNHLHERGVNASGWDNERCTWFLSPEIVGGVREALRHGRLH